MTEAEKAQANIDEKLQPVEELLRRKEALTIASRFLVVVLLTVMGATISWYAVDQRHEVRDLRQQRADSDEVAACRSQVAAETDIVALDGLQASLDSLGTLNALVVTLSARDDAAYQAALADLDALNIRVGQVSQDIAAAQARRLATNDICSPDGVPPDTTGDSSAGTG